MRPDFAFQLLLACFSLVQIDLGFTELLRRDRLYESVCPSRLRLLPKPHRRGYKAELEVSVGAAVARCAGSLSVRRSSLMRPAGAM